MFDTPGSGRSAIAFAMLKIVVTAPVPMVITSTAMTVKTGLFRSIRTAKRKSRRMVSNMVSDR